MKDIGKKQLAFDRRTFLKTTAAAGACLAAGIKFAGAEALGANSTVYMVKGSSRVEMIPQLLKMFGQEKWKSGIAGKSVVLKPNFNSAHAFPGSTHPDTLKALLGSIRENGPSSLEVIDRAGMGNTEKVMKEIGLQEFAGDYSADLLPYEKLGADDMIRDKLEGGHWSRGIEWPRKLADADSIVQTCCLKTHQYGGHFTLSLKNSVGMVSRFDAKDEYNYMRELHRSEHQRRMIAEINALYHPTLVILDGMSCFVDGGPHIGTVKEPGVILASTDRVALDAVGVAILRHLGTTPQVADGKIFQLDQIKRAAQLGIGVKSAENIVIKAPDSNSDQYADTLRNVLAKG